MLNYSYERILDLDFLVRYGYYDFEIKKETDVDDILEYAYSPTVYEKIFNMNDLAEIIKEDKEVIKKFLKISNVPVTEPIYFSIPKNESSRRLYKLPNIYNYLILANYINDNKKVLIFTFENNQYSTSKYFNQFDIKYKITQKIKKNLLMNGKKRFYLDLANFYHTLYTHSIPWVVNGKEIAKQNKKGGFANNIDYLIQQSQYGDSYGIPVGNLLSRIITEYYMCHIDSILESKYVYARYVDDIVFPFNYEEERLKFLGILGTYVINLIYISMIKN